MTNLQSILSPKQREILQLMSNGLCDKEIAQQVGIAYGTVRNHVDKINLKLCATNRTHAVALAIRNNII